MREAARSELALAAIRAASAQDVLSHGTRSLGRILADDTILRSPSGQIAVSFTRSPEVAAYWALLPRGYRGEEGGILVLSRDALASRFRLDHFHDPIWDTDDAVVDEHEERVVGTDVDGLSSMLAGTVRVEEALEESAGPTS